MSTSDIGIVGLGVMGANLALNLSDKGYRLSVYNRTGAVTAEFIETHGQDRVIAVADNLQPVGPSRRSLNNCCPGWQPVTSWSTAAIPIFRTQTAVGEHLPPRAYISSVWGFPVARTAPASGRR